MPATESPARPDARPVDPDWAWAPYEPDARRPWDLRGAGHLFRRAGFGAAWPQLKAALADGPQKTVDRLLRPPDDAASWNRDFDAYETAAGSVEALRAWWLRRMIKTPHPLLEKMTLFWHGHFGISAARVGDASLVGAHVRLLRANALGRFGDLLDAVSGDPAVFLALGAGENRKARPSETYARTFLEQYTLGPGNFGDEDARDFARAMTGWFVLRGRLRWFDREHDPGQKTVLGRQGQWGREDVVRIVLDRPAASRRIVRKLYRWLISETDEPSDEMLAPLAESFAGDGDVGRLVETVLRSNAFHAPAAYRRRVKSPVELAVGMARAMEAILPTERLGADLAALGQDLYRPPTVEGWAGGPSWLNAATLVGRAKMAGALLAPGGPYGGKLDPAAVAKKHGHDTPEAAGRFLVDLLLDGDLDPAVREKLPAGGGAFPSRCRETALALVTLPEFQLA